MYLVIIINFLIGLLIGAILEFVYRSIEHKKIVLPKYIDYQMYGLIGALLVVVYYLSISIIYKFVLMFALPTIVEFLTGYLYFKIKRKRLWDYRKERYNFKGTICLLFSIVWFFITLVYYYLVLPLTIK